MIRNPLLFTAALLIGCLSQTLGAATASAEPREVAKAPGIAVFEDAVERDDGGAGTLLIVRLEPSQMTTGIVNGNEPVPAGAPWSVTINGSYFNDGGVPVYHLRDGDRVPAPFRRGANAVFWCRESRCEIQHSTDFAREEPYDLAVQAAPRIQDRGQPTKGVRGGDVVDGRAGLAITTGGSVLAFSTSPLRWGGLSFDQVRAYLKQHFQSESILMLDGGNSARLRVQIGNTVFGNGPFSREVPYSIRFKGH